MRGRADAAGAVVKLSGVLLEIGDEFTEIFDRKVLLGDDQHRRRGRVHDWFEIGSRIVGELRIEPDASGLCAEVPHQQRVAVRSGLRDASCTCRAAGTGKIFYDNRLAERPAHMVRHQTCDDIRGAACCEWHDQRDRLRGVGCLGYGRGRSA